MPYPNHIHTAIKYPYHSSQSSVNLKKLDNLSKLNNSFLYYFKHFYTVQWIMFIIIIPKQTAQVNFILENWQNHCTNTTSTVYCSSSGLPSPCQPRRMLLQSESWRIGSSPSSIPPVRSFWSWIERTTLGSSLFLVESVHQEFVVKNYSLSFRDFSVR